jgi:putative ABC transport system ATP-binding protein
MGTNISSVSDGINSDAAKITGGENISPGQASFNDGLIKIDHLEKTYAMGDVEVHALRGVSFNVVCKEFVAIMGASGSGKSTFMNILGCLDKPTSGTYILDNINVGSLSRDELAFIRNKKIGFVFQGFNLLSRTTALENVELPLFYNSTSTKLRKEKSIEALKKVGLEERIYHYPNQLSGGQQQRVAIARALVNDPSIVLADEPTGNLDSKTSIEVMEIFQKLNEQGITIILVTHEPDIALFAKRHIIFRDGKIISDKFNAEPNKASEVLKTISSIDDEVKV